MRTFSSSETRTPFAQARQVLQYYILLIISYIFIFVEDRSWLAGQLHTSYLYMSARPEISHSYDLTMRTTMKLARLTLYLFIYLELERGLNKKRRIRGGCALSAS